MPHFTIDVLADQCGVTPANIRSWQRYGLLKPHRDEKGHRFFDHSHIARIAAIVGWLHQGVALSDMLALFNGERISQHAGWSSCQQQLLAHCESFKPQKLRALIWRFGREIPPAILVDEVLRPLRRWFDAGEQPAPDMSRVLLDTALIEYATFLLNSVRKRPAATLLIMAFDLRDPLELWLEAIRYAGDGFRVEVLSGAVADPELSRVEAEHIMIWSERMLTVTQRQRYDDWLASGFYVFLAGPGAKCFTVPG
ncbi:MerR family transcriptional regulator [Erwiniaceae bacterium BAC15a-03b]|uniref:MerR family transcriptional regulator n=1 Tax=Winslowiella arboricola TaxID=2978220 RepID=A0A9J6PJY9_9GAMM|nr:MerR family transcriptional regulator [Winslowiella arboricola]MCU5773780.1 MerR family transcriptional regulator [Winslowiella arboricola]MCU5777690.1 MerR family transcriptional regulator [Winslowiella arboricola]